MGDVVRTVQYFKVQVSNKAGEAVPFLRMLQEGNVNLLAFLGFPRNRRAQMDFVPSDPATFKALAKRLKWKIGAPKSCFLVEGDDRVGAVAEHAAKLAAAKINVTAIAAVCGGAGRYGVVLWVKPKDVRKAGKALGAM